jgi:hypothetical protein
LRFFATWQIVSSHGPVNFEMQFRRSSLSISDTSKPSNSNLNLAEIKGCPTSRLVRRVQVWSWRASTSVIQVWISHFFFRVK